MLLNVSLFLHWFGSLGLKICLFNLTDSQQALPYLEIKEEAKGEEKKLPILPPPPLELCCMSGCQNCVMIQHAEELIKMYGDDSVARAALEEIPDEGLKAFFKMELMLKK